jgi:hypothetical protein
MNHIEQARRTFALNQGSRLSDIVKETLEAIEVLQNSRTESTKSRAQMIEDLRNALGRASLLIEPVSPSR